MRLIDADALTEKCGDWYVEEGTEEGFIGTLEQLLSGQPEINCSEIPNNWIPCRERLPEEGKVVLTQAKFKDDVKMAVSSRIDYNYWTTWGTRDINIIAWMPLPEPYKGEQK